MAYWCTIIQYNLISQQFISAILQVEELQSEVETVRSLSKDQKDEINELTANLELLNSKKTHLESQCVSIQTQSTELDNKVKDCEVEKVG